MCFCQHGVGCCSEITEEICHLYSTVVHSLIGLLTPAWSSCVSSIHFVSSFSTSVLSLFFQVLCLHLKRFRFNSFVRTKINCRVTFPSSDLQMAPYTSLRASKRDSFLYNLAAVVVHHGSGYVTPRLLSIFLFPIHVQVYSNSWDIYIYILFDSQLCTSDTCACLWCCICNLKQCKLFV